MSNGLSVQIFVLFLLLLIFLHKTQLSQHNLTVLENNSILWVGLYITVGDEDLGILVIIHRAVVMLTAWHFWWYAHVLGSHGILANKHFAHEHVAFSRDLACHSILVTTGVICTERKVRPLPVGTLCTTQTDFFSVQSSQAVLCSMNR